MSLEEIMNEAYIYFIGDGYTFDRIKAVEYYEQAIKLGSEEAIYQAARCYEYLGKRDKNNYYKALEYYNKVNFKDAKEKYKELENFIKTI